MRKHPMFGLALAAFGALVLTPDTLLMRWSGLDGFQMLAWRGLLMGSVFLLVWAARPQASHRSDLSAVLSVSGFTVVVTHGFNAGLFTVGIASAPVSVVLFGVATVPIWAALFARLLLGEVTTRATWLTIAAVLSGIVIAVSGKSGSDWNGSAVIAGALCGLGVAASLALGFVILRRHPQLPITLAIGAGALLAGTVGRVLAAPGAADEVLIWPIAVTGLLVLPLSFFALSLAARHTQAANVSLLLLLETILGPVWVWLGTGERPTLQMLLGGTIVVASLAIYLSWAQQQGRRVRVP